MLFEVQSFHLKHCVCVFQIQHCSNKLGVPLNCIFPVKNYFDGHKLVEKMDGLILDALQNIVNYADDYLGDT